MRFSWEHLVAIGVAVIVILLAWFLPPLLHVTGVDRVILSVGILVIGAVAIGALLLWARSNQPPMPTASVQAPSVPGAPALASFGGAGLAPEDLNQLIR